VRRGGLIGITAASVAAAAGIAAWQLADDGGEPAELDRPLASAASYPPAEGNLTPAQTKAARELILTDPGVQPFLAQRDYQFKAIGSWTTGGRHPRLIGALALVRLAEPASYAMAEWPTADFAEGSDPPYDETTLQMAASGVEELTIDVDLVRERVVSVSPGGDELQITPGPDFPPLEPSEDAGY
jgi:hypothetical protein